MISWDIQKAFDSVGQNLQYLAWRRLGLPKELAHWLVLLDKGGTFSVRTPHLLGKLSSVCPSDTEEEEFIGILQSEGFCAQRGVTKGDVKSTLCWVAVFDILLTALNRLTKEEHLKPFYSRHHGSYIYPTLTWAFADDLVTITPDRDTSLRLGKFISMAMAVLGLKLAVSKLRVVTTIADTR